MKFILEVRGATPEQARQFIRTLLADDDCHGGLLMDDIVGYGEGQLVLVEEIE